MERGGPVAPLLRAIGVDLGGTKIAVGVVSADGNVELREQLPSNVKDPDAVVDQIQAMVETLAPTDVAGIGIGAAGLVDHETGRYLYGPNTGLRDFDLGGSVAGRVGLPTFADNDANCAAWAEHRFGVGRGTEHFICVTLGTGIGGGLVLNGAPYRGARGGAAEVGHMLVDPDGPMCACGRRGCWEQLASGLALERMARERLAQHPDSVLRARAGEGGISGPDVTAAAREGDGFARRMVEEVARWVGWGLGSLFNIFEPERIAVAGGIAKDWDLFAGVAQRAMVDRIEAAASRPAPEVLAASLGGDAGVVGAACLVFDRT